MNCAEFRKFGKEIIDYIADYCDTIRQRQVVSSVEPGYLKNLLPAEAPEAGDSWPQVLQDLNRVIAPGLTHWHSPNFHAYYPTANSYPGIVGELLSAGLGIISTDQFPNPACVELERKMMDWLAKILDLPKEFMNSSDGPGGGFIQNAASESTLVALLAAKNRIILETGVEEGNLVAYTSEQSNSSVEKAGLLASVTMRLLRTDEKGQLRGEVLKEAINEDIRMGLTPCCVIATLGTTGTCSFDQLDEIGPICQQFKIWLHVDAAYAGSAFACPEYRHLMKGVEFADSFNFNPHKWMLVNSDCSAMWFRDIQSNELFIQIPDSRRFRALKLWFVLRIYGVEGIRTHIRGQIALAKFFQCLVESDQRFEVCTASMGLVCFRLKGEDGRTKELLDRLAKRKNIFVMPYYYQSRLVIRFVICSRFTEEKDVVFAWREIKSQVE
ncbi:aromatic-L-amino-acid decarboxylase [Tribolium castaneum]|uniref:Alpha-methyldopa hypersensitive protein-like Protein n=1 Tax=Tribolium castaneum TaxID=7070 RepID=D6WLR4_TRICA|nr:PREDICTED: aromatic-L-amino-acid decarboxylase [Tribolium castaneum]EFA03415.1 Alpha-methyldopa hypersensitive protein-like Protein [Tribolium castaneum]|eukprot:XP_973068.2 PREDICTED: aromatic-L-amino-acid decarboxylase [Tribolium castaneum]